LAAGGTLAQGTDVFEGVLGLAKLFANLDELNANIATLFATEIVRHTFAFRP
jgi:hypothetical protein